MTTEEEKKNKQDIQMGQLSKNYEEEKQSLINKHREELEEFEAVKQEDVKKLENKIQIVKADLNSLQQFKQEKTEKEKELIILHNEKLASIGQLAAGVAHEINNPMGFITSNLQTLTGYFSAMGSFIQAQRTALEQTAPAELNQQLAATEEKLDIPYILEDGADLVVESLDGAKRVARIVRDLRSFSRIDAPEYEEADLTTCLVNALNIVAEELSHVATVIKELTPLPPISCHPGELNQVFMNLLRNAGQAITPPGTITLKSRHDDKFIFVTVGDDGHGIPDSILDRIYEPFFTTKDVGKGTGLGLSVTRDIVTKHGGEIMVESSNQGTTFTIKLPRNSESMPAKNVENKGGVI